MGLSLNEGFTVTLNKKINELTRLTTIVGLPTIIPIDDNTHHTSSWSDWWAVLVTCF